ncbi:MAG TPA: glycosyltransferase [Bacteroidia bacterium]|jgi:glycosyltransferase involved in cell wall biosynthesis
MTGKRLLFYYPSNKRTIALETLLIELRKTGYEVLILTTCAKGDFHFYLESIGFTTFTNEIKEQGYRYYIKQMFFFIKFCRQKKIQVVHSHLQHTNFIATLGQFFIKARVIVFRHHFRFTDSLDEKIAVNKNEMFFDRIINRYAKKIVVPSNGVYNGIKKHEQVNMGKIKVIPYIYDFSQYQKHDEEKVNAIKKQYPCKLRLIMVSRLIRLKRHYIVFPVINELVKEGYDIRLLVMDEGPEKQELERYIDQNNLKEHIIMLGFRTDFVNFMAAADLLVQPSLTDASNSAAKEMALFGKPVAVCDQVGDYNDYIINNVNGFLMPVNDTASHLKRIIKEIYAGTHNTGQMGTLLKKEIIEKFDISHSERIIQMYKTIM